jgi:hypothetical protein
VLSDREIAVKKSLCGSFLIIAKGQVLARNPPLVLRIARQAKFFFKKAGSGDFARRNGSIDHESSGQKIRTPLLFKSVHFGLPCRFF